MGFLEAFNKHFSANKPSTVEDLLDKVYEKTVKGISQIKEAVSQNKLGLGMSFTMAGLLAAVGAPASVTAMPFGLMMLGITMAIKNNRDINDLENFVDSLPYNLRRQYLDNFNEACVAYSPAPAKRRRMPGGPRVDRRRIIAGYWEKT